MLNSQLTNCSANDISASIDKINCKLVKLSSSLYGNAVYMMNNNISAIEIFDLLMYKRILTFRQVNPNYCWSVLQGEVVGDIVQWNKLNLVTKDYYSQLVNRIIKEGIQDDTTWIDIIPTSRVLQYILIENTTPNIAQLSMGTTDGGNDVFSSWTIDGKVGDLNGLTTIPVGLAFSLESATTLFVNHSGIDDTWNNATLNFIFLFDN